MGDFPGIAALRESNELARYERNGKAIEHLRLRDGRNACVEARAGGLAQVRIIAPFRPVEQRIMRSLDQAIEWAWKQSAIPAGPE